MQGIPVGDCEVRTKTCKNTDLADRVVTGPGAQIVPREEAPEVESLFMAESTAVTHTMVEKLLRGYASQKSAIHRKVLRQGTWEMPGADAGHWALAGFQECCLLLVVLAAAMDKG